VAWSRQAPWPSLTFGSPALFSRKISQAR